MQWSMNMNQLSICIVKVIQREVVSKMLSITCITIHSVGCSHVLMYICVCICICVCMFVCVHVRESITYDKLLH